MQEPSKVKIDEIVEARKTKLDQLARQSILEIIKNFRLNQPSGFYKVIGQIIENFERQLPENPWIRKNACKARKAELKRLKEGYNKVKRTVGSCEIYDDQSLIQLCFTYKKSYENVTTFFSEYNDLPKHIIQALSLREEDKLRSSDMDAIAAIEEKLQDQYRKELCREAEDVKSQLSAAQVQIEEYKQGKTLIEHKEKIENLTKQNHILKMNKEGLEDQLNEVFKKGANAVLIEENQRLNTELTRFREQLTETVRQNSELITEVQTLKQNVTTLGKEKELDQQNILTLQSQVSTLGKEKELDQQNILTLQTQVTTLGEEKKQDQQNISDLQTQMKGLVQEFRQLKEEKQQQQNRGRSEKDYRSFRQNSPSFYNNGSNDPRAPNFDDLNSRFNNMCPPKN